MEIKAYKVPIRKIVEGYVNNSEDGVMGLGGKLNIRPAYQREFVYKDKQRDEVINTVRKKFPLNIMYWVESANGYEVLDGQQRTISICEYVKGSYSIDYKYFHNLTEYEQDQILDYELNIYVCKGNEREKLDWFKVINIAGEKLTDQELRNAVYTGSWLNNAKKYFSKTGCPASEYAKYLNGSSIRQDYLETVLDWISGGQIEQYMGLHQHDGTANELWQYTQQVFNWVKMLFPNYRKEMKGLAWGRLYDTYKNNSYDFEALEKEITRLMADDDVTKKAGIYEYVLSGNTLEKCLNIRAFTPSQKRTVYTRQGGVCPHCGKTYKFDEMEGDHITPWKDGGKTDIDNLQMLCKNCNRKKSGK
jgi:hypothetical protein